jgi:hypothetical protein
MYIDPKGDRDWWHKVMSTKKVRYKKKKKTLNIFFYNEPVTRKKPIVWPKILPKDYKVKGKNYIHHAAEKCDIDMLEKAIHEKHDLARHDSFGKNALYYFFTIEPSKLIDIEFFKKILIANKEAWKPINTYDFFSYFSKQIFSIIKFSNKHTYDEVKYENIMSLYRKFKQVIKDFDLPLAMVSKHFYKIEFSTTIQGEIIEDALNAAYNKENCLKNLIERVNLFKTPVIKAENKEEIPFLVVLDDFGYYSVKNIPFGMIQARSGIGKSMFFPVEMLGLEINPNADQDKLYDMWKKNIIKNKDFYNIIMSDELFKYMQKYNNILASSLMKNYLDEQLEISTIKKSAKKIKI